MKVPGLADAVVPRDKIIGYLLSVTHPAGRGKAEFFRRHGFGQGDPDALVAALLRHATDNDIVVTRRSRFGTKYIVEGRLATPDGREPLVRVVWFVTAGESTPRLVTAYPCAAGT